MPELFIKDLHHLQEVLSYQFSNPQLLKQALTHRSFSADHNERLEFMGDAILSFIITKYLYMHFEQAEGVLSRVRSHLVREEVLASIGTRLNLGTYLQLGSGELRTGGDKKPSILADAVEAIVAAIYFDLRAQSQANDAIQIINNIILKLFEPELSSLNQSVKSIRSNTQDSGSKININIKDAKTKLQEYLQSRRLNVPKYQLIAQEGESHQQFFTMSCEILQLNLSTEGRGLSKKIAEQIAAEQMLKKLGV